MLERYFVLPDTIDHVRSCWIGKPIELYVAWLAERDMQLEPFIAVYRSWCVLENSPAVEGLQR